MQNLSIRSCLDSLHVNNLWCTVILASAEPEPSAEQGANLNMKLPPIAPKVASGTNWKWGDFLTGELEGKIVNDQHSQLQVPQGEMYHCEYMTPCLIQYSMCCSCAAYLHGQLQPS